MEKKEVLKFFLMHLSEAANKLTSVSKNVGRVARSREEVRVRVGTNKEFKLRGVSSTLSEPEDSSQRLNLRQWIMNLHFF